ncbi:hypothetical protein [Brevibacillus laterosporus]|uniref:Uncharacterized protein n=1 Tax=Brevibacillus laterosporus TaxID=1465 RepID=A0AAP3GE65_BRELA|nr:hypothetical protein [Brevibacillus laterosporus]MCR8982903.1 hypothetical protein [Brevibacillus laterosporus]MCZ0810059.1 hypothetical protein [Brevibacillus laterosporus]MCZ0828677.1 hypothetical protein [Brevibacillus laterosporus]MCZ0853069.1 hypothetical protein [Brevibacillus laterosporus]
MGRAKSYMDEEKAIRYAEYLNKERGESYKPEGIHKFYSEYLNKEHGESYKPEDIHKLIDDSYELVLHKSEFLKAVLDTIDNPDDDFGWDLDVSFLSRATKIDENLILFVMERGDHTWLRSIVIATIGLMPLARLALDYYGIGYFLSIHKSDAGIRHIGDDYYSICVYT